VITCRYCTNFQGAPVVSVQTIKQKKKLERWCRVRDRNVLSDTKRCVRFNPATTFHCDKYHQRYDVRVCVARKRQVTYGGKLRSAYMKCLRCSQYNAVRSIVSEKGIKVETEKLSKIRRRRKVVIPEKAKIRRRKKTSDKTIRRRKPETIIRRRKTKTNKIRRRRK
jgi:hypothetical protein